MSPEPPVNSDASPSPAMKHQPSEPLLDASVENVKKAVSKEKIPVVLTGADKNNGDGEGILDEPIVDAEIAEIENAKQEQQSCGPNTGHVGLKTRDHSNHRHHTTGGRSSRGSRGRKSSEDILVSVALHKCKEILQEMMEQPECMPFNQPVDPEKLNIPDYFDLIKEPMDFGTIMAHLNRRAFSSPGEFATHMHLVFSNAMTYNPPGHPIHTVAQALKTSFAKQFSALEAEIEKDRSMTQTDYEKEIELMFKAVQQLSAEISTIKQTQNTEETHEPELANTATEKENLENQDADGGRNSAARHTSNQASSNDVGSSSAIHSSAKSNSTTERPSSRPLSSEEKRQLSRQINRLSGENLPQVVKIIQDHIPSMKLQNTLAEMEIDLDALDTDTLRALERHVISSKPGHAPARPASRNAQHASPAVAARASPPNYLRAILNSGSPVMFLVVPPHLQPTQHRPVQPQPKVQPQQHHTQAQPQHRPSQPPHAAHNQHPHPHPQQQQQQHQHQHQHPQHQQPQQSPHPHPHSHSQPQHHHHQQTHSTETTAGSGVAPSTSDAVTGTGTGTGSGTGGGGGGTADIVGVSGSSSSGEDGSSSESSDSESEPDIPPHEFNV